MVLVAPLQSTGDKRSSPVTTCQFLVLASSWHSFMFSVMLMRLTGVPVVNVS